MKKNDNGLLNFVLNLKPEEVSEIIKDYELIESGYQYFYIVDTYDIINYTLPFTSKDFLKEENKDRLSHQAIAYDSFFGSKSNSRLILLDEYKYELLSIKNTIQRKIKNFPKTREEIIELIGSETFLKEDNKKMECILSEKLNIIIAVLIFIEYGDNIYKRLNNLMNERLNIYNYKSDDIDFDDTINQVFKEVRISKISEDLYSEFVDDVITILLSLESDIDRAIYLENAYRDIAAIDRIIGVTNTFKELYPSKKMVFIYLSSTPFKTESLFRLMKKLGIKLPTIDKYEDFNFSRNIFQCFLLQIILQKKNMFNSASPIDLLEFIKSKLEQIIFLKSSTEKVYELNNFDSVTHSDKDKHVLETLALIINDYDKRFENSLIFDTYLKYRTTLDNSLSNLSSQKSREKIIAIVQKTDNIINTSFLVNSFATPFMNISNIKQSFYLTNRFNYNHDLFHEIKIPLGKDIIKNSFHHFPGLLLIDSSYNSSLTEQIFIFLDLILTPQSKISSLSENFNTSILKLINILSGINRKSLSDLTLEFLTLSLINLVTRSSRTFEASSSTDFLENEKEIIDVLKRLKSIITKSSIRPIIIEKNGKASISFEEVDLPITKEIDYLLLWLWRRDNKLTEAIKLGEECINKYRSDGRFLHGLGLAHHSIAYKKYRECIKNKSVDVIINHFLFSKENLLKALGYYSELTNKFDNNTIKNLIFKNLIGIHNTIADAYFRLFQLGDKSGFDLINASKFHVDEMDRLFKLINVDFIIEPTVNHTKSELHYFDALHHFEIGELAKAHFSILEATARILYFEKCKEQVDESFQSIAGDISKLRYDIFKKMGYFK
jgi:hypothetical protein